MEEYCTDPVIRKTASPDTGLATVDVPVYGALAEITLPPGNYPFYVESGSNSCTVNFKISGMRLDFPQFRVLASKKNLYKNSY